jgi:cobalamin biosynthesis Mg chelatase CobN
MATSARRHTTTTARTSTTPTTAATTTTAAALTYESAPRRSTTTTIDDKNARYLQEALARSADKPKSSPIVIGLIVLLVIAAAVSFPFLRRLTQR